MPYQFLIDKGPGDRFEMMKPEIKRFFSEARPNAHRYLFQSDACAKVGELLRDGFDLIVKHNEFARPPYDNIYIEMEDQRRLFGIWKGREAYVDETSDTRVGFLIRNNFMLTISEGPSTRDGILNTQKLDHSITLFSVGLNKPQSAGLSMYGDDPEIQQVVKAAYVTGGIRKNQRNDSPSWEDVAWQVPVQLIKEFSAMYDIRANVIVPNDFDRDEYALFRRACFLGSGDVMIALAALLLLNQKTDKITYETVGHSSGIVKGKRTVFKAHSVVKIHLEAKQTMRTLFRQMDRAPPVVHDVCGHWVHYGERLKCEHHWEPLDISHDRYRCAHCGLRRTWRKAHVRGTAERGVNTKHYNVTV